MKNPILTVTKETFICSDPNIIDLGIAFQIDCNDASGTIPDPTIPVWIPWDDCNEISEPENVNDNFCSFFDEADFLMQIEQNPGPNFIRFEFPGTSDGRSVIVESGTYQITEEGAPGNSCPNTTYEDGGPIIEKGSTQGAFCFTLEGDCSGTIQAGEEKACTVKNYLSNEFLQYHKTVLLPMVQLQ